MPEFSAEDRSDRSTRTIWTERVRLRFEWINDRWHHGISVRSEGEWIDFAQTLEHHEFLDPPGRLTCPAYQQFHYQEAGGRSVALLVGQSGPHHLSASFELEENAAVTRIMVDVADRVRASDPSLACSYYVCERPSAAIVEGPSRIAWEIVKSGRLTLSGEAPGDRPTRVVSSTCLWSDPDSQTHVEIVEDPEPAASTLRCRYHWTFEAL